MKKCYKIFLGLFCAVSLMGCGRQEEVVEEVTVVLKEEIEAEVSEEISEVPEEVIPEEVEPEKKGYLVVIDVFINGFGKEINYGTTA